MKPILIIPPDLMAAEEVNLLRENEICVVLCKDPSKVKFLDPIPSAKDRGRIADAAIKLSRILLNRQWGAVSNSSQIGHAEFARLYIECLMSGTELDAAGTTEEQDARISLAAHRDELAKIARAEARESAAAKKQSKVK